MKTIGIEINAEITGEKDIVKLERELDRLADTMDGDLAEAAKAARNELREALESAGALRNVQQLERSVKQAGAELARAQRELGLFGGAMRAAGPVTAETARREQQLADAVVRADQVLKGKRASLNAAQGQLARYGLTADQASEAQARIAQSIDRVDARVRSLSPAYAAAASSAEQSGRRQAVAMAQTDDRLASLSRQLQTLRNVAGVALGGTLVGSLARDLGEVADQYNNLAGRIKLATGEGEAFSQGMADVQRIAQGTNSELEATGQLYAKLIESGRDAGQTAQQAQADAARLTEVINQAIQLSGASAQASSAALTQLLQGLNAGVLRGEEFNSVMEQSPRLARALADGLGVTVGELRALAQQGRLTSEVVRDALGGQAQQIAGEFEQLPPTIGRAMQSLSNAWTVYVGETDKATGSSKAVAAALSMVAENLETIIDLLFRAGEAAAAFTALRLAQSFLAIGAAAKTAAAGIAATTTAMGAAGASAAATGAAIAATASRVASVLKTIRSFSLVGLVLNLKDIGTWLGEAAARMAGYKDATEDLAEAEKRAAVVAQESARMKAAMAQEMAKAADAARGLTPEARVLTAEFEKLRDAGKSTGNALAELAGKANLQEPEGIRAYLIALRDLEAQGKASGDQIRQSLADALKGEDLARFEVLARTALAGAREEAELLATVLDSTLREAIARSGLDFNAIKGGMSAAARSAINDTDAIIANIDRLAEQGVDTAAVLTASLGKGIETADSQAAFEALRGQVESVRKVLGDQVADAFLEQIENKAREAAQEVGGLTDALKKLGITSDADLKKAAEATRDLYEQVRKGGGSAREQAAAFQKMAEAAIRSGDSASLAYARAQAAANGFEVAVDKSGKTIVRRMGDATEAVQQYGHAIQNATQDVQDHVGELDRVAERLAEIKRVQTTDGEGFTTDKAGNRLVMGGELNTLTGIFNFLKSAGVQDDATARRIAMEFSDGNGNVPYFSNPGQQRYGGDTMSMALLRAAEQVTFGAGSGVGGTGGAASVGRTVNMNINFESRDFGPIDTSPTGERHITELMDALVTSKRRSGR